MSSISSGTTTTTGYVVSSDTTGALVLKTGSAATTAVTIDTSQNVTFAGSQTLSAGTANGVTYLNGSKVLTSGSGLTFDGTNLGVGGAAGSSANYSTITARGTTGGIYEFNAGATLQSYILGNSSELRLQTQSTQALTFVYNGSEAMRLNGTGLGIGTSSPTDQLTLYGGKVRVCNSTTGTSSGIVMGMNSNDAYISNQANGYILFGTNNTERMRLDSAGNLGLGVTPSAWTGNRKVVAVGGTVAAINYASLYGENAYNCYTNGTNYLYQNTGHAGEFNYSLDTAGGFSWKLAPSGTAGNAITFTQAMTLTAAGNLGIGSTSPAELLHLSSSTNTRARIETTSTGSVTVTQYKNAAGETHTIGSETSAGNAGFGGSSAYAFCMYAGGTTRDISFGTNGAERARITSGGELLVGTTSAGGVGFSLTDNAGAKCTTTQRASGTGATNMCLYVNPNGTVGTIQISGTSTSYNTSSDYRLKNTIAPMTGALAKVALLKPVTYKWNADGSDGEGFIAHELAEVVPQCVTGEKDAVDAEGNPLHQGIDTSFLVATLTAAIQEQQAIIESLKARLDAANI